jgi:hypothetical protein
MFERLLYGIESFFNKVLQSKTHRMREQFEEFVSGILFPKKNYEILHQTPDSSANEERYNKSSDQPDFKFRDYTTGKSFWVECKYQTVWRGKFPDQYLTPFLKEYELDRYTKLDKDEPVFIAVGTGGVAYFPTQSYLIPVRYIKIADRITKKYLLPFESHNLKRDDERLEKLRDDEFQLGDVIPILSASLWKRLNH